MLICFAILSADIGSRRYSESDQESFFPELVSIVAKDILRLSSGY